MIRALLAHDPRIEVIGEAPDPFEARELIKALNPDVLTLDVEMPRMNGLVFLEKLMRLRPMPVVMVSTRTAEQSDEAVKALSLGAVDCIDLKRLKVQDPRLPDFAETLVVAAGARLSRKSGDAQEGTFSENAIPERISRHEWNGRVVLMGSSTGGVDALLTVFSDYPEDGPPTIVAQHMPAHFLESFSRRLDSIARPRVRLARDGDALRQGEVLLAPGGRFHTCLKPGATLRVGLREDTGDQLYIPSVSLLFGSAAPVAERVVGVMLTGMGRDGATELAGLREAGAHTIVQSGRTSVVDGMPKAARELGAGVEVADLNRIAALVLKATSGAKETVR